MALDSLEMLPDFNLLRISKDIQHPRSSTDLMDLPNGIISRSEDSVLDKRRSHQVRLSRRKFPISTNRELTDVGRYGHRAEYRDSTSMKHHGAPVPSQRTTQWS